jgi:hypothetical protein
MMQSPVGWSAPMRMCKLSYCIVLMRVSRVCGKRVLGMRRLHGCGAANDKVHVS